MTRLLPLVLFRVGRKYQNTLSNDHSSGDRSDEIVEVHFTEMTEDR